jgi:hypothetical protein
VPNGDGLAVDAPNPVLALGGEPNGAFGCDTLLVAEPNGVDAVD